MAERKRKGLATKPQAIHIATRVTVTPHGPKDTDGATVTVVFGGTTTKQEYTRISGAQSAALIAVNTLGGTIEEQS